MLPKPFEQAPYQKCSHLKRHVFPAAAAASAMPCPAQCGYPGDNLEYHYRYSPYCRPVDVLAPIEAKKRTRDCSASARTFGHRVTARVGMEMLTAHTDNYIKVEHLDKFRNLIIQVAGMVVNFINDEAKMGDISLDTILEAAQAPFKQMPPAATMLRQYINEQYLIRSAEAPSTPRLRRVRCASMPLSS